MAKKSKSKKNGAEEMTGDDAPKPGEGGGGGPKKVMGLIAGSALRTLIKSVTIMQNKASTAAGEMGDLIRTYAEKKNLHKGAFADIKKLHRMGTKDPAKLWLHLAHFDHMRKEAGLDDLADSQGEMLPPGTEEIDEPKSSTTESKAAERAPRLVPDTAGGGLAH